MHDMIPTTGVFNALNATLVVPRKWCRTQEQPAEEECYSQTAGPVLPLDFGVMPGPSVVHPQPTSVESPNDAIIFVQDVPQTRSVETLGHVPLTYLRVKLAVKPELTTMQASYELGMFGWRDKDGYRLIGGSSADDEVYGTPKTLDELIKQVVGCFYESFFMNRPKTVNLQVISFPHNCVSEGGLGRELCALKKHATVITL
jgi:hypothetical protein